MTRCIEEKHETSSSGFPINRTEIVKPGLVRLYHLLPYPPAYLSYPLQPRRTPVASPSMPSQPFSTEAYFQTQRPPAGLDEKAQRMDAFVQRWQAVEGARVVLVTSGGTTVPLESNT